MTDTVAKLDLPGFSYGGTPVLGPVALRVAKEVQENKTGAFHNLHLDQIDLRSKLKWSLHTIDSLAGSVRTLEIRNRSGSQPKIARSLSCEAA